MCISTPKVETPTAPPKIEQMDATQNVAAARQSDIRRRQRALGRSAAMTGSYGNEAAGKTRLGQ